MDKKALLFPSASARRRRVTIKSAIFVDPGIMGTGWAFFQELTTLGDSVDVPYATGVVRAAKKGARWDARAGDICSTMSGVFRALEVRVIVIEFPELWATGKSYTSAAGRRRGPGDLFKLTFLIGGLGQVARQQTGTKPVLVMPREWKGQLPKKVVIGRIAKRIPGLNPEDHEADAIGMGLAAQGLL